MAVPFEKISKNVDFSLDVQTVATLPNCNFFFADVSLASNQKFLPFLENDFKCLDSR